MECKPLTNTEAQQTIYCVYRLQQVGTCFRERWAQIAKENKKLVSKTSGTIPETTDCLWRWSKWKWHSRVSLSGTETSIDSLIVQSLKRTVSKICWGHSPATTETTPSKQEWTNETKPCLWSGGSSTWSSLLIKLLTPLFLRKWKLSRKSSYCSWNNCLGSLESLVTSEASR